MHLIADAADVEDDVILAVGVDEALVYRSCPDHLQRRARCRGDARA